MIVYADWPGRSPQAVEDQVTYPLSANLQGLAGVKTVRASSMFGFTFLTVIFEDKVDNYFARTRVLERLNLLGDLLPRGVIPQRTAWHAGFGLLLVGLALAAGVGGVTLVVAVALGILILVYNACGVQQRQADGAIE